MKVVVGVDASGFYESAIRLLSRLKIDPLDIELLHIDEVPQSYPEEAFAWTSEVLDAMEKLDEKILSQAEHLAVERGMHSTSRSLIGSAAGLLMEQADVNHTDLIAIGSYQRSRIGGLVFGSVGRALAIGAHHSVLIAKGEIGAEGPITAIATTDHSRYSDQALRLLCKLKPLGIQRLILLTALDEAMVGSADELHIDRLREYFAKRGENVSRFMNAAGIPTEVRCVEGELDQAIKDQMAENNADLLIMGAQGHGFLKRLFIGSTTLREVVTSSHSILILRP